MRAAVVRALVLAMVAAGARTARAGPPPITWDAPPDCPSQPEVEALAAAMLAGSLRSAPDGARIAFTVVRDADRFRLRAVLHGPDGSGARTLSAGDCTSLAEAAALIAAIVVDPAAAAAVPEDRGAEQDVPEDSPAEPTVPQPPAAAPQPTPPAPAEASGEPAIQPQEPPPPPADERPPRRRVRPRGELGVDAGLVVGALPRPAALLRLRGAVRTRHLAVGLRVSAWLPREAAVPGHPAVGGRFWLASAGVYVCGVVRGGRRVEFPLCAAVDVGALGGRGTGDLAVARSAVSPWAGLSAGPGVDVAVHPRLALTARLEGLAVVGRPRFEITGYGTPCCAAVVGGQFTAGLAVRLP
jgi:hypothetical protein